MLLFSISFNSATKVYADSLTCRFFDCFSALSSHAPLPLPLSTSISNEKPTTTSTTNNFENDHATRNQQCTRTCNAFRTPRAGRTATDSRSTPGSSGLCSPPSAVGGLGGGGVGVSGPVLAESAVLSFPLEQGSYFWGASPPTGAPAGQRSSEVSSFGGNHSPFIGVESSFRNLSFGKRQNPTSQPTANVQRMSSIV